MEKKCKFGQKSTTHTTRVFTSGYLGSKWGRKTRVFGYPGYLGFITNFSSMLTGWNLLQVLVVLVVFVKECCYWCCRLRLKKDSERSYFYLRFFGRLGIFKTKFFFQGFNKPTEWEEACNKNKIKNVLRCIAEKQWWLLCGVLLALLQNLQLIFGFWSVFQWKWSYFSKFHFLCLMKISSRMFSKFSIYVHIWSESNLVNFWIPNILL